MKLRIFSMLVLLSAVVTGVVAQSTYKVTLKSGTADDANWSIEPSAATTTGVVAGTQITATYSGTKKVKSVRAIRRKVTGITLNKTKTIIKVGSTEPLSVVTVVPDNATNKTYTWKTSDETKATVSTEGVVTAVAAGAVTIYAEANDGSGVKGNCSVAVAAPGTPAAVIDDYTAGAFEWDNASARAYHAPKRTSLLDPSTMQVGFNAGDEISILSTNNYNARFTTTEGGAAASFSGTAVDDSKYYAIYPYTEGLALNGTTITGVTIPTNQWNDEWNERGKWDYDLGCSIPIHAWDPKVPLAYAVTEEEILQFHNLCAILKIRLTDPNNVVLTGWAVLAISANEPLVGTFSLETSTGKLTATTGSTTVTIGTSHNLDLKGNYAYIAIAPGTYTNFTVEVCDDWDVASKTKSTSVTFEAGKIYDLGSLGSLF